MSSKRITINKILSNESLVQENQYFQVSAEQGALGRVGLCPSDTAPILTASIGNDQGVRAQDRGKDFREHSAQPPHIAPVLTPEAKWSGRGR